VDKSLAELSAKTVLLEGRLRFAEESSRAQREAAQAGDGAPQGWSPSSQISQPSTPPKEPRSHVASPVTDDFNQPIALHPHKPPPSPPRADAHQDKPALSTANYAELVAARFSEARGLLGPES
jgi:hypothetical protein